jgi:tetratricopeptide (TPR) repeat protein
MEFNESAIQIIQKRWSNNCKEALDQFKAQIHGLVPKEKLCEHPRLINALIDCLREQNKLFEAVAFLENYLNIEVNERLDKHLAINMGWLYHKALSASNKLKDEKTSINYNLVNNLLVKLYQLNEKKLFEILYCKWLEKQLGSKPLNHKTLLLVISNFDPFTFSEATYETSIILKGKPKTVSLASNQEKSIVLHAKAYYALSMFEKCIQICETALNSITDFHYSNNHWLARLIALSYRQQGNLQDAIHALQLVLKKRKDWFLQKELAEIYQQAGQLEQAVILAEQAAKNGGYIAYKASLFEMLGVLYEATNRPQKASVCYGLSIAIRKEQNWKIPLELSRKIGTKQIEKISPIVLYQKAIALISAHEGIKQFDEQLFHGRGAITRILHNGPNGDGFITDDKGLSIYFRYSQCQLPYTEIYEGLKVSFRARKSKYKEKNSYQALKVFGLRKKT